MIFPAIARCAVFAAALLAAPAAAQEAPPRTIVVGGMGEATAVPDQAQVSVGVVAQGQTAAQALDANAAAMDRVFMALETLGIPENKIQTSNFSLAPQYPPFRPDNPEPQRIVGYQVSNQVTVILDDVTRVGITADALVRVGANQLNGISFSIADPKPLAEQARRAAVADAMAKARTLAEAAGVSLGPLLNLQESGAFAPRQRQEVLVTGALTVGTPVTPIAGGEQMVTVNVTMTYGIQ